MRTKILMALVAVLFFVSPVFADVVYNFDTPFAGATPSGNTPWLIATFTQHRSNEVDLTLRTTGLVGSEFVSAWYFNYSGSNPITILQSGGSITADTTVGSNAYEAVVGGKSDGKFDMLIQFPTSGSDTFTNGLTEYFAIRGTDVRESMFNTLSTGGTWPYGLAAAYVQSIGTTGGSGLVTDTAVVPDPPLVWLLGSGLVGLVGIRKRLRK